MGRINHELPDQTVQRRPMTLAVMLVRGMIAAIIVVLVTASE